MDGNVARAEPEPALTAVKRLLAEDLREKAFEDLHGVIGLVQETPELVDSCLVDLETEITKSRNKDAYIASTLTDASYTSCRVLRLKFLRAANFNPQKAANRMIGFFEKKLELFGRNALARDLSISDLDEDDKKCLASGLMTLVPEKDKAGRGILTWMPMVKDGFTLLCKVRLCLCLRLRLLLDSRIQRSKGVILGKIAAALNIGIIFYFLFVYRCAVRCTFIARPLKMKPSRRMGS
jgi:hypothetical protein